MKKRIVLLVCSLILIAASTMSVCAAQSVPQPVLDASGSVVRIFAGEYTGTGFIIAQDDNNTYVVTNYHVIEDDPDGVSIWISDESIINAALLVEDKERDMCVLKIGFPLGMTPVKLSAVMAAKGDAIYAVGFPGAADGITTAFALDSESSTITDGIVSSVRRGTVTETGPQVDILQISAAINPGNSGGPVFNETGSAVGISTFGMSESQGIFGAISINELKGILDSKSIPYITDQVEETEHFPIWVYIIFGVASLLVIVAIVLLIVRLRKSKKKQGQAERTSAFRNTPEKDLYNSEIKEPTKWGTVIGIAAMSLATLLIIVYVVTYAISKSAADDFRFSDAYDLLIAKPITKLHDKEFYRYVDAGETMNREKYEAAAMVFEALGEYENAESLAKNCRYQMAKTRMGRGDYEEAAEILEDLNGYSDSRTLINECKYQIACRNMQSEKYHEALAMFKELAEQADYKDSQELAYDIECSIAVSKWDGKTNITPIISELKGYADAGNTLAESCMEEFKEMAYNAAVDLYHSGDNEKSKRIFGSLPSYEDSDKYYTLAGLKQQLELVNTNKIVVDTTKNLEEASREALFRKIDEPETQTENDKVINIISDVQQLIPFEDSQSIFDYCLQLLGYNR